MGPLVLDSWVKYPADHLISLDIMDLFDTLAANKFMHPALNARAMPTLVNMINNENPDKGMVSSAIDMLKSLVQGAETPLPAGYVAQFFPNLMSVLLTTDDRDILQSGQECLTFVIQKGVEQVAEWLVLRSLLLKAISPTLSIFILLTSTSTIISCQLGAMLQVERLDWSSLSSSSPSSWTLRKPNRLLCLSVT